jgi:hypothetical protein
VTSINRQTDHEKSNITEMSDFRRKCNPDEPLHAKVSALALEAWLLCNSAGARQGNRI